MTEVLSTRGKLVPEEIRMLERDFYATPFYFSYSSLNKLLWNPGVFYQEYVLKQKEVKTDRHLVEGRVIHALLLSKKKFNDLFVIMPGKLPTENTKQLLDRLFKREQQLQQQLALPHPPDKSLKDCRDDILELLKVMDVHQALKDDKPDKSGVVAATGDDKRMEKILTPDALEYWSHLKSKGTRDVIDQATMDFCTKAEDRVRQQPHIMELMGLAGQEFEQIEVLNEQLLKYELVNYPFGIHGILDNLVLDHDAKVIRINDVKTTSKDLKDFTESVEYYMYWMQAIIYITLVLRNYKHLIAKGYTVEFRFIVIDRSHQVYAFPVSAETLETWRKRFDSESLFKAYYHYQNNDYSLPYEFAEGLMVL